MARKTFEVENMRNFVNGMLSAPAGTAEYRKGAIAVLERILHETGNYNGFAYLNKFDLGDNVLPGVNFKDNGEIEDGDARFANTDETRRRYF